MKTEYFKKERGSRCLNLSETCSSSFFPVFTETKQKQEKEKEKNKKKRERKVKNLGEKKHMFR